MLRTPQTVLLIAAVLVIGTAALSPCFAAEMDPTMVSQNCPATGGLTALTPPTPVIPKASPELAAEMERSTLLPLGPARESVITNANGTKSRSTVRHLLMIEGNAEALANDDEIKNFLLNDPNLVKLSADPETRLSDYLADPELETIVGAYPSAKLLRLACSSHCPSCDSGSCFAGQNGSCGVCICSSSCPFTPCICGGHVDVLPDPHFAEGSLLND